MTSITRFFIKKKPANVILVYDTTQKPEQTSWKSFEEGIGSDIDFLSHLGNYKSFNVIVVVFSENSFSFDSVNREKERSYNIKKKIDSRNLFFLRITDHVKSTCKGVSKILVEQGRKFYRNLKATYKGRMSGDLDKIKYAIRLALLSRMKCLKDKTFLKYLRIALDAVIDTDLTNLEPTKILELQTVSKWVFEQFFQLNDRTIGTFDFNIMTDYNNKLTARLGCPKRMRLDIDWRPFSDQWKVDQNTYFLSLLGFNSNRSFQREAVYKCQGYYNLQIAYSQYRILQYTKDIETSSDSPRLSPSKYYGQLEVFGDSENPLNHEIMPFEPKIYFLEKLSKLNREEMTSSVIKNIEEAISCFNVLD